MEKDYKEINADTYDKISKFYARDFINNAKDNEFVEIFAKYLKSKDKVLDFGCGPGNLTKVLVKSNLQVIGLDISNEMIKIAKQTIPEATFVCRDMQNSNFENNSFDGILACRSLIHIANKDIDCVMNNFVRLLKPNGKLGIMLSIVPKAYEGFEQEEYATLHKHSFIIILLMK